MIINLLETCFVAIKVGVFLGKKNIIKIQVSSVLPVLNDKNNKFHEYKFPRFHQICKNYSCGKEPMLITFFVLFGIRKIWKFHILSYLFLSQKVYNCLARVYSEDFSQRR